MPEGGWVTATEACQCPTDARAAFSFLLSAFPPASPMGFGPGHRRGAVVLVRDRQASTPGCSTRTFFTAEAVRLELTSGLKPPPVFKTGSSSGRMTSVIHKLGEKELNLRLLVQSQAACR